MAVVFDPGTGVVWPVLLWMTYPEGAFPLGASHARVTVQSVTPATRRLFGAATPWASAALEFKPTTSPSRMVTMRTYGLLFPAVGRRASSRPGEKGPIRVMNDVCGDVCAYSRRQRLRPPKHVRSGG